MCLYFFCFNLAISFNYTLILVILFTTYHILASMASLVSLKVVTLPSFDLTLNDNARKRFSPSLDGITKMIPLLTPYQYC